MIDLQCGDCLELMKDIPSKSIDLVLCDLPYGVLNKENPNAAWDKQLPFSALWDEYLRIAKEEAAIILFASGMFTADLMQSNRKIWKYNLVWKKGNRPTGFLNAKKQPLRITEDICVFYRKQPTYNPQFTIEEKVHSIGGAGNATGKGSRNGCYGTFRRTETAKTNLKYPTNLIDIPKEHLQKHHPTQKPVELLSWLIKTYSNEGDTVLDNCMGSGSTGVACVNTRRDFVGIELDPHYFEIAKQRIEAARRRQSDEKG